MSGVSFDDPLLLVLCGAALLPWIAGRRRGGSRWERRCSAAALLFLGLALAQPRVETITSRRQWVFVVDQSPSVDAAAATNRLREALGGVPPGDEVRGIVVVGDPPGFYSSLDSLLQQEKPGSDEGEWSDLGGALVFAGAKLRPGLPAEVVLLSDGIDTGARVGGSSAALRRLGVRVSTLTVATVSTPEVFVAGIDKPARLLAGERVDLVARVVADRTGEAEVMLYLDDLLFEKRLVKLGRGENRVVFGGIKIPEAGLRISARVNSQNDTDPTNNSIATTAEAAGRPGVMLVAGEREDVGVFAGLLERGGFRVTRRSPGGLPSSGAEYQGTDALVLAGVPASAISANSLDAMGEWVRGAGGILVATGGGGAFAAGGYDESPLGALLPVRSRPTDEIDQPVVALLISLDRSGSMQAEVDGRTKLSLANAGAVAALKTLRSPDFFGLHAVDTRVHRILPLQPGRDVAAASPVILRTESGGGGIYVYTALLTAGAELRGVPARIRHIILFADAADAEEKSAGAETDGTPGSGSALALASGLAAEGINLSVVALGSEEDKDVGFLRELALRGGGRFYLTGDARSLPSLFVAETNRLSRPGLLEEPVLALPGPDVATLGALDLTTAPFLFGTNIVRLKSGAEELLRVEALGGESPLLARWRVGLGWVVAHATDITGHWSGDWLAWEGHTKLWTRLLRGMVGARTSESGEIEVELIDGRTRIRYEEGAAGGEGALIAEVRLRGNEDVEKVRLAKTAPGSHEAAVGLPYAMMESVAIRSGAGGRALAEQVVERQPGLEFGQFAPDRELLREIARFGGGVGAESVGELFSVKRLPETVAHRIDWICLLMALVAFVGGAYFRRRFELAKE